MNRYRVKEGTHLEDGKAYTKGQVVVSEFDLASLFREKFEALGPAPISPAPAESAEEPPKENIAAAPAPEAVKKGKTKKAVKSTEEWDDEKE